MKKTVFSLLLILAINSCNTPYTPPEVVGTWIISAAETQTFYLYGQGYSLDIYPELKEKVFAASDIMQDLLKDPKSIILEKDGKFQFKFFSGDIARGNYTQENNIVFFKFETDHYPQVDGLFAETNGVDLLLYLSSVIVKPMFLQYLNATDEEINILFGADNPLLLDMEGAILYKISK
ncbi:MAG: hypothetical protein LBC84_02540 [Prevotellaceae bacterium]|jgi:hypothetical protein|nr:hypothetical protein [Prevotellaceae bacterium]